jgi:hypothetical protein
MSFLLTGLRQKTIRKQPQTQVLQGIYTKEPKTAKTQVYPENHSHPNKILAVYRFEAVFS